MRYLLAGLLLLLAGCGPSAFDQRVAHLEQDCDMGSASACIGLQDAYAMRRQALHDLYSQPVQPVPMPATQRYF